MTVRETRDVIPLLPAMYDEPFADSSQIPTHLVSRFAREQVTVALTGDGGDELFAGYNRHFAAPRLWQQLQRVPQPLRGRERIVAGQIAVAILERGRAGAAREPSGAFRGQGPKGAARGRLGAQLRRSLLLVPRRVEQRTLARACGGDGDDMRFDLDIGADAPDAVRMMYCDGISYLPDDILAKVDRASMAVALETRVPFLDHRVAELAARIPLEMKVRNGRGKHIVRELLYGMVPRELVERPKAGFGIPVGQWIKGPLRPWAEELLDPGRMRAEGWFDAEAVSRRWRDHLSGTRKSTPALWAILMFQAWLGAERESAAAAA